MTQSIALAQKFQPILDEIYKRESLTARLDALTKPVNFAGANVVQVFKTNPIGLGTYSRVTGYPAGQMVGAWEALTLATERGRSFVIDRMDDEETLGMAFGTLAGEFIRTEVAPELDAYRFAKYASAIAGHNVATPATLTPETIITALDAAKLALDQDEVPREGRILYISDACLNYLEGKVSRFLLTRAALTGALCVLTAWTLLWFRRLGSILALLLMPARAWMPADIPRTLTPARISTS